MKTSRLFFSLLYILILFLSSISIYSQSGWVQLNSGITNNFSNVTAINPNIAYVFNPLLKTTNGGVNWVAISAPGVFGSISFPDVLTGYASNGTVYKTTDGGSNWSDLGQTLFTMVSFPNATTGYGSRGVELIGGWNYYYLRKTTDGGLTWTNVLSYLSYNTAISWYYFQHTQAPSPQVIYQTLWFEDYFEIPVIESSVLRSTNGGLNWNTIRLSDLYHGDTLRYTTFHFPSNDTGYVVGSVYPPVGESYILRYTGGVWTTLRIFYADIKEVYFPTNTTGYILTGSYDIYKTTNSGDSWYSVNPPGTTQLNGMSFANALTGYAVGDNGVIIKTTTGGESAALYSVSGSVKYQDNNDPVTSGYVKALKYDSTNHVIITVDSAQIQPSGTYTLPNCPPVVLDIMAYENDEEDLSFVPTYYVSTIYWQNSTHVKPDSNLSNINIAVKRIVNSGDSMHVAGYVYTNNATDYSALKDAVIYARAAGTFKSHSVSLSNGYYCVDSLSSGVYELIVDRMGYEDDLFVISLTNSSLNNINFYLQDALVPVNIISSEIPASFMLNQNYPNPFNPLTSIEFSIASPGFTKLVIYDILGREVKVLLAQHLQAGTYKSNWDAGNYPSGVYFYRLETGDFTASKKMLLIK